MLQLCGRTCQIFTISNFSPEKDKNKEKLVRQWKHGVNEWTDWTISKKVKHLFIQKWNSSFTHPYVIPDPYVVFPCWTQRGDLRAVQCSCQGLAKTKHHNKSSIKVAYTVYDSWTIFPSLLKDYDNFIQGSVKMFPASPMLPLWITFKKGCTEASIKLFVWYFYGVLFTFVDLDTCGYFELLLFAQDSLKIPLLSSNKEQKSRSLN